MASKAKFFSWSKGRQSTSEPYHRTGGLLPIDTSVGDADKGALSASEAKSTPRTERRRPPNLAIIPPDYNKNHLTCLTPASAHHNAALVNSASNLLAVVNDMLRSPALSANLCSRTPTASIHKPLPSRPRSVSLPSTPDLPAELPGSILLENQGFPSSPVAGAATQSTMRSVRSGNSLSSNAAARPSPSKVPQHKKSFSEGGLQRRSKSRPSLITSPSSTDSKLTTCSVSTNGGPASGVESTKARVGTDKLLQPSPLIIEGKPWKKTGGDSASSRRDELDTPATPTPISATTRNRQIDELKATITAQDQTISTLQAQFASLRVSHEAHIASVVDAHAAEVASLRNYAKALEEQQAQRTLHHASSNHLLFLLDTTDPQSPRDSPQTTAGSSSATSIRSFQSAFEQQTRSSRQSRDSPEMENLKRKLSAARRPETGNRDAIRELNMYKQNNVALQKQIESLMAKLNESMKREKEMKTALERAEKVCVDWQQKASKAGQMEKNMSALQNTIDHLEHRLEIANCEKVDAEEQLLNIQLSRTPWDPKRPKVEVPSVPADNRQSTRTSMSTVFANDSPISQQPESEEPTTLAAFIAHIERLQEQIRHKDAHCARLEAENWRMRQDHEQLERDHRELNLQSDIQGQLLKKTKRSDVHIEQLRNAIIEREAIIGEKDKALRMAERQLEHHQLLLQAEVRRHAATTLLADVDEDPLPDLTSLASKEDIDKWTERLQSRLKKAKESKTDGKKPDAGLEAVVEDLRKEIDFYVREIIYYKLDIRGYKSDIKKLKSVAARMGSGSRTSDLGSPTPSQARSTDTPIRTNFTSAAPGLGISGTPSPVSTGPISVVIPTNRPITPPASIIAADVSPLDVSKPANKRVPKKLDLKMPMTPQTPPRKDGTNAANEADHVDPGISPRSVARLSPERRKPTPPSPDQERFGDLATNFPLSTPAAPKRHDTQRSMSDSIIQLYVSPRTPDRSPAAPENEAPAAGEKPTVETRSRSASNPDPVKARTTPERPRRPHLGLFESPIGTDRATPADLRTHPCMDVMAEAMRHSPDTAEYRQPQAVRRIATKLSNSDSPTASSPNYKDIRSSSSTASSALPAPLTLRTREQPPSPSRRPSTPSSSNIPFVIAMGSPHNPALMTPSTTVPPAACTITGKVNAMPPTLRAGVGGTMASTTPVTSPVSPTDTTKSNPFFFPSSFKTQSSRKPGSASSSRNASISSTSRPDPTTKTENHASAATFAASTAASRNRATGSASPGHSRNVSGSSIRSAVGGLIKGKGKTRKDSISAPTPLASPFDIDRSTPDGGRGYGIGEAI